jgi:hypothetical protein
VKVRIVSYLLDVKDVTDMDFRKITNYLVLDEIKNNPAPAMLLSAIVVLLLGIYLYDSPNASIQIISKALITLSTSLIGAGVFSVLSQTSRYTTLIKNQLLEVFDKAEYKDNIKSIINEVINTNEHLDLIEKKFLDVFFDPKQVGSDTISFQERWRILTESRLKEVLPMLHKDATMLLENHFFNSELEYHFENYSQKYDIDVDENGIAVIKNTFKANIIKNKAYEKCNFKQGTTSQAGEVDLIELEIAGKRIQDEALLGRYFSKQDYSGSLMIDLNEYQGEHIRFKRVFTVKQDLKKESYITTHISKYIKGGQLKVKVSSGYKITFIRSGFYPKDINAIADDKTQNPVPDSDGYQKWLLASSGSLLLPGQGFILTVTPDENANNI